MSEVSNNGSSAPSQSIQAQQNSASPQDSKVQEAPQKSEPQMTAAEKRILKLKIDGAEESLPEEEVIKLAQMGKSASKRFSEAAKMKRQAEDFISLLKSNPRKVLSDPSINVDLRKFAEEYLSEIVQQEMLSPEERKMREMEAKIQEHENEKKAQEKAKQEEEITKLRDHYAQDYDRKFTEALKSNGLPKSPQVVKRMAELMFMNLENGFDLEPAQIASLVKQDYISAIQELFGQSDEDTLLALLGDGVANKIRKADLKRIKTPIAQAQKTVATREEPKNEKRYMTRDEWKEELDRRTRS